MGERNCSVTHHVWRQVLLELRAGGVSSAVHQLWLLRRSSPVCWERFADVANSAALSASQYRLIASLWELSREPHLEDIAPRLGVLPDSFCNSFR